MSSKNRKRPSGASPRQDGNLTKVEAQAHLREALATLRKREREIEAEYARLEGLQAEKERIGREMAAVQAALDAFGESEPLVESPRRGEDALLTTSETEAKETTRTKPKRRRETKGVAAKPATRGKAAAKNGEVAYTGNKTEFVRAVVESRGEAGAAPQDIDQEFQQRGIEKSKNAIYNALADLVRQNKLMKRDGLYFVLKRASKGKKSAARKGR